MDGEIKWTNENEYIDEWKKKSAIHTLLLSIEWIFA